MKNSVLKRLIDILVCVAALFIFFPVFVMIAAFSTFLIQPPIFFYQKRTGFRGRIFTLVKFRTMTNKKDLSGNQLPDHHRITKFGSFLRSTSLDELPTLFNVLRGEMSIVGPRPLLPEYLPLYSAYQTRRHETLPGITGLAQINNLITKEKWNSRIRLDLFYVEKICFYLDMLVIIRTMKILFTRM